MTIFTKKIKTKHRSIEHSEIKNEIKNAESAYNSHIAGKKKRHVKNGSPKSTNTIM